MPFRKEWIDRIKAAQRAWEVMRFASDSLQQRISGDPTLLPASFSMRDLSTAIAELEGTYVVRLFAEFEAGLRQYWATTRSTHPRTRDLIDGIAAARAIPHDSINDVHVIREYRNGIVHEREEITSTAMDVCQRHLCIFFSRLPDRW